MRGTEFTKTKKKKREKKAKRGGPPPLDRSPCWQKKTKKRRSVIKKFPTTTHTHTLYERTRKTMMVGMGRKLAEEEENDKFSNST